MVSSSSCDGLCIIFTPDSQTGKTKVQVLLSMRALQSSLDVVGRGLCSWVCDDQLLHQQVFSPKIKSCGPMESLSSSSSPVINMHRSSSKLLILISSAALHFCRLLLQWVTHASCPYFSPFSRYARARKPTRSAVHVETTD
jgi:hypothetical protein